VAEHCLIEQYTDTLLAELPARLVEEITDGLFEANAKYLRQGLGAAEAAHATVTEFGDAHAVVEAFISASPARRIARRLVVTGPVVGACWALALITGGAWQWPVPAAARWLLGATLAASVIALVTAALARRYRVAHHGSVAGCAGLTALDLTAIVAVVMVAPGIRWLVVLAACASAARLLSVTRAVRLMFT
jgi:hypothetical protein